MSSSIGPTVDPPWWNFARQVVMFLLGVVLIVWWAVERASDRAGVLQLLAGLALLGLVPLDRLIGRIGTNPPPPNPNPPIQP